MAIQGFDPSRLIFGDKEKVYHFLNRCAGYSVEWSVGMVMVMLWSIGQAMTHDSMTLFFEAMP